MKPQIISRKMLVGGLVLRISLKYLRIKKPRKIKLRDGKTYKLFKRKVDGEKICFHLFDLKKCVWAGKHFFVEAQVWQKEYADGTTAQYIDLHPTKTTISIPTVQMHKFNNRSTLPKVKRETDLIFNFGDGALVFSHFVSK